MHSKTMLMLIATALLAGCTHDAGTADQPRTYGIAQHQEAGDDADAPTATDATDNLRTEVHVFNVSWEAGIGTPATSAIVHWPLPSSYGGNFTPPPGASLEAEAAWTCTVDPCDMDLVLRGHNFTTQVGGASPLTLTHDRLTEETWKVSLLTQVVSRDVEGTITATLAWKE